MDNNVVDFKKFKRPPHPDKSPAKYLIYGGAGAAVICALLTLYLMWSGNMIGIITFGLTMVALWVMRKGQDMKLVAKDKFDKGTLH